MKFFKIQPKNKNSVIETNTWIKVLNGKTFVAIQSITWEIGQFTLKIPESLEEIEDTGKYVSTTAKDEGSFLNLPSEEIKNFNNDEYFFEVDTTNGATDESWVIEVKDNESDIDREMIEEIEKGIEEEGDEYLYVNGWEEDFYDYCIVDGIKITPA